MGCCASDDATTAAQYETSYAKTESWATTDSAAEEKAKETKVLERELDIEEKLEEIKKLDNDIKKIGIES